MFARSCKRGITFSSVSAVRLRPVHSVLRPADPVVSVLYSSRRFTQTTRKFSHQANLVERRYFLTLSIFLTVLNRVGI